jgi:hypothetical protein
LRGEWQVLQATVGALEPQLPLQSGICNLELQIRSVPVNVASKSGYLFSSEDLPHWGSIEPAKVVAQF